MFKEWLHYKERVQHFQQCLLDVETQIYEENKLQLKAKPEGTVDLSDDTYKVKVTNKLNRTIDQEGAAQLGGIGLATKYSWSKTEYNKLDDTKKQIVDAVITSKPAKPNFKVEIKL